MLPFFLTSCERKKNNALQGMRMRTLSLEPPSLPLPVENSAPAPPALLKLRTTPPKNALSFSFSGAVTDLKHASPQSTAIQMKGTSWTEYKFSAEPVEVNNIIVERSGKDVVFLLYGTQEMDTASASKIKGAKKGRQSVIFYLDFASQLRPCEGSESATGDFEQWEPRGSFQSPCILGHEVKYTRRKRDVACMTGKPHVRKAFVRDCQCQEEDFECDINYHRPHQNGACQFDGGEDRVPNKTVSILHQCGRADAQGMYFDPNGYRKVAGDTCVGGISHVGSQISCPAWATNTGKSTWMSTFFKLVLFAAGCCVLVFTERGRQFLALAIEYAGKLFDIIMGMVGMGRSPSRRGYQPVSRFDDASDFDGASSNDYKKKTPSRASDTFKPFSDGNDNDKDNDLERRGVSGTSTRRRGGPNGKQLSALDRVAAALEPHDDDDDDKDDFFDDDDDDLLGDDLDDFNPRAGEDHESLL